MAYINYLHTKRCSRALARVSCRQEIWKAASERGGSQKAKERIGWHRSAPALKTRPGRRGAAPDLHSPRILHQPLG